MPRKFKLAFFLKEVQRLDPQTAPEDSGFKTGVILMAALQEGTNADHLAKFTGYNRDFVRARVRNARKNGVFQGHKVACEWFEENGGIAFWCDVAVAEGMLARAVGR